MKVFKYVMQIAMLVSVITIAYLCGTYSAKFQQNQKDDKSTIMTVAVVNADTGVMTKGEKKYYASEFMLFPDANFKSASLEEAENGVSNGSFAAYILIPENFSKAIESVNGEPVKMQISYALYHNLRQDVEMKVVNDIHNFILNLSTNVSYVYVNAILKEVHAVQDDSQMIMQNDVRDREAIEKVQSAELIAEVEYEPLEVREMELEYMDLSPKYERLQETIFNIDKTYTDAVSSAQEEFVRVKTDGIAMNEQVAEGEKVFAEVDILTDAEGSCVYEKGMESLGNAAAEFDEMFREKQMTAKQRLGFQEGDEEPEPEPELPDGEERVYLSKDDLLDKVNKQIHTIETISENTLTINDAKKIKEGLNSLKADIDEYYLNAIRAINEIPAPSEITPFTQDIINDEIVPPLMGEIAHEAGNVSNALNTITASIDNYVKTIDEYDAMSYLDSQAITDYQGSLHETIYDMENEIMEQDAQYLAYIEEVERIAESNTEMLQESLETSYEQTTETIGEVMTGFQENRETLNDLNVSLLEGITRKLPYTRLGTLEYAQVYDFIVQPVVSNDVSGDKVEISPTSVYLDKADLIGLCAGVAALVILYVSVLMIHRKLIHANEKGEEGELWQTE